MTSVRCVGDAYAGPSDGLLFDLQCVSRPLRRCYTTFYRDSTRSPPVGVLALADGADVRFHCKATLSLSRRPRFVVFPRCRVVTTLWFATGFKIVSALETNRNFVRV